MPLAVLTQTDTVIFLNDHHVKFTTAVSGVIDTNSRKVTYAWAGHHPPILAKPGEAARALPNHGFALGVEQDLPHVIQEHEFRYEPRTLFVSYTDGPIESRRNGEEAESRFLISERAARTFQEKAILIDRFLGNARESARFGGTIGMPTEKQRVTAIANLTHGNTKAMATTRRKSRAGEPTTTGTYTTEKASVNESSAEEATAKKTSAKKATARRTSVQKAKA